MIDPVSMQDVDGTRLQIGFTPRPFRPVMSPTSADPSSIVPRATHAMGRKQLMRSSANVRSKEYAPRAAVLRARYPRNEVQNSLTLA